MRRQKWLHLHSFLLEFCGKSCVTIIISSVLSPYNFAIIIALGCPDLYFAWTPLPVLLPAGDFACLPTGRGHTRVTLTTDHSYLFAAAPQTSRYFDHSTDCLWSYMSVSIYSHLTRRRKHIYYSWSRRWNCFTQNCNTKKPHFTLRKSTTIKVLIDWWAQLRLSND